MVTALLLHISLAFPSGAPLSPLTLHTAVAEAAGLWSRYGVAIDAAEACGWTPDDRELLTVVIVETRPSAPVNLWRGPLAAIRFGPDGAPTPVVTVFLSDLLRYIADTRVLGAREWQWPPAMRDQIIGRVLGRVLAHEIGHYVLRSPHHGAGGLMQPVHFADLLVAEGQHRFALSAAELARLRIVSAPEARQ